jgi:hypothetical protein
MDLIEIMAKLVIESDAALADRLEYQDEVLSESVCTEPMLGKCIDAYDIYDLFELANLSDEDFAQTFPALAHVPAAVRRQVVDVFEKHLESCSHCWLKAAYDRELNARIDRAWLKDRDRLLQLFQNDESVAEDEEKCGEHSLADPILAREAEPRSVGFKTFRRLVHPQVLMAATATSVLVIAVLLLFHSQHQKVPIFARYQEEMSRLNHTDSVQVVELAPSLLFRSSDGEMPRIPIQSTTTVLRFDLLMPARETYMTYNVTLETEVGEVVSLQGIKRVGDKVTLFLPASLFKVGDYMLTVSPHPDGPTYNYYFRAFPVDLRSETTR